MNLGTVTVGMLRKALADREVTDETPLFVALPPEGCKVRIIYTHEETGAAVAFGTLVRAVLVDGEGGQTAVLVAAEGVDVTAFKGYLPARSAMGREN